MLLASCINVFSQGYYSASGNPTELDARIIELITETLFSLDLLFCFLQEYNDVETYRTVREVKTIAKHYLKGSFIFDLLAIIPFYFMFDSTNKIEYERNSRLIKLLKLLRVPRLFALLNVDKIKKSIQYHYEMQLYDSKTGKYKDGKYYPTLKVLNLVRIYKIFRLVIIIFTSSFFLGILWYIYITDIQEDEYISPSDHSKGVFPTFRSKFIGNVT